jgi:hypothetical protein
MSAEQKTDSIVEMIATELSVAYVKYGGNAADGSYFFSFSRQHIYVPHRKFFPPGTDGITLKFHLGKHVPENFIITGLVSTFSFDNLSPHYVYCPAEKKCREIETVNKGNNPGFFSIGILVIDTNTDTSIFCDPQVVNGPGEGDNT